MKRRLQANAVFCLFLVLVVSLAGCGNVQEKNLYSNADNWAYLETDISGKAADVFFICPTVYGGDSEASKFNMELDDTATKESFWGATNMEKGIYDVNCRFFAPYYQQVGLNVYELEIPEREQYLSIAYADIKAAFEYYMEHYNNGHPMVLAALRKGSKSSSQETV